MFGTPYVVGTPIGTAYQELLKKVLWDATENTVSEETLSHIPAEKISNLPKSEIAVIGESITCHSLAQAIELEHGKGVKVLYATECDRGYLREKDVYTPDEMDVIEALKGMKTVIADPLYRPVCPSDATFIPLPSENFSGRIYRKDIPNLIEGFEKYSIK